MSISFRLRYFLGLIPNAQKIDLAWAELYKMRDKLRLIEESEELARYNELRILIHSADFQSKKKDINNLNFKGSDEYHLLNELDTLEKLNPIKRYFKFIQSSEFERFNLISKSSDLQRYHELEKIVHSPDFVHRQKETNALLYKGSPEYLLRKEYLSLEKSGRLKRYYATISSEEYQAFLKHDAVVKGELSNLEEEDLKVKAYRRFLNSSAYKNLLVVEKQNLQSRIEELKKEVNDPHFLEQEDFLRNKNRYSTTPDYPLFIEFSKLSKSDEILFYLKCFNSSHYANFKEISISAALGRLQELRLIVNDPEFKQRVDFLRNKKRYELTSEYKFEIEFKELENSALIVSYHQLKKRSELLFFDQWEILLDENFLVPDLSSTIWEPENFWGSKIAGFSFSQASELQAYKGLANIEIKNQVLSIVTKAEKSAGKVWDPSFGLLPKEFEYTSAMLNSGSKFKFRDGIVEAKVKFQADGAITSAFSLTGSHPFPQFDIFRSGSNRVGLGIIEQPGNGGVNKLVQIKGLNFSDYHIFRLEVFGNSLVWKINNFEVHREQYSGKREEMFLNFIGSIHKPHNTPLPHHFEIDWVRCYRKKSAES